MVGCCVVVVVIKLFVRLTGATDTAVGPTEMADATPTFVDDDTDVVTDDEAGQVYVELDKLTGRGSTEVTVDDGIDGSDSDLVRGLCVVWLDIRTSDRGAKTDGNGARLSQLLILSTEPSPCIARVTGQSLCCKSIDFRTATSERSDETSV